MSGKTSTGGTYDPGNDDPADSVPNTPSNGSDNAPSGDDD